VRDARAAGQIAIRNTGGVYDGIMRRSVYDPFTKATGIDVVGASAPMSKMIAAVKAGGTEYDVVDAGSGGLTALERLGALVPIDYGSSKFGKPEDFGPELRHKNFVACFAGSFEAESAAGRAVLHGGRRLREDGPRQDREGPRPACA